jgi:hypothetical protein
MVANILRCHYIRLEVEFLEYQRLPSSLPAPLRTLRCWNWILLAAVGLAGKSSATGLYLGFPKFTQNLLAVSITKIHRAIVTKLREWTDLVTFISG